MRKLFSLVLALVVMFGGVSFADIQIDRGQTRGVSGNVSKFFVARNGRAVGISADRVVVWDSTSNDGVTVTTSTTSFDNLVAGVTIDAIPGTDSGNSSDTTAANDSDGANWGRVRVYGRHAGVSFDSGATSCSAGARIGVHSLGGNGAGQATPTIQTGNQVSADLLRTGVSGDSLGIALEACAAGNKTLDIFINKG